MYKLSLHSIFDVLYEKKSSKKHVFLANSVRPMLFFFEVVESSSSATQYCTAKKSSEWTLKDAYHTRQDSWKFLLF